MAKGASKQAQTQMGIDRAYAQGDSKSGAQDRSQLFPFLTNEVNNPQGYGASDISRMETAGGQSVSGSAGAATEGANLLASRTGNTAAVPGIIDATARSGMAQQSDNALNILNNNAMLKQKQQQAGAGGMESLYQTDTGNALKALGLGNEAINSWTNADNSTSNTIKNAFDDFGTVASAGTSAYKAQK